jgi:hypothetical protein
VRVDIAEFGGLDQGIDCGGAAPTFIGQTTLLNRERITLDHHATPPAPPTASRVMSSTKRARASHNLHCSLSQKTLMTDTNVLAQ